MYGIRSTEQAQKAYDTAVKRAAEEIAAKPGDANEIAHSVLAAQACLQTWSTWDQILANIVEFAPPSLSEAEVGLHKMFALAELALKNPDDAWSGRGNEARRVQNEARREVLSYIKGKLALELGL